jgi:hypothetical protein
LPPFIRSANGLAFYEGERWPVLFHKGGAPQTMDRVISKWIVYLAIGLAVAYVWVHFDSLAGQFRARVADWWR